MSSSSVPPRNFSIDHRVSDDGTPILVCRGRINLETSNLFKAEVKNLSGNSKVVLADLSAVDAVDSSGLGGILGTYISAKSDGCELKLINVHPFVKDLLNITHLTSVLNVTG